MTDFTSDAPLARARHTPPRREYYAYFALIFLATLPLALLTWALGGLRRMEWPDKGPVSRAWSQARIITPHIFQA
jgi:hypothetical protein